jgi:hypothetical protein
LNGRRGPAARLLSSPRRRRRLRNAALAFALAGVVVFIGLRYSNTGRQKEHFSPGPVQRVAPAPRAVVLSSVDRESVRRVAALFIDTAVLRRRVDRSWVITTPKLHQGLTRKQWDTGNIPVTPFPAAAVGTVKYRLDFSGEYVVYLKVAILPKPTSSLDGQAFDLGLARNGRLDDHSWLVDYWVPSGIGVPATPKALAAHGGVDTQRVKSRLPVAWIFVPVGLFVGLLLGLPLAIFGRHWLRARRAMRDYQRERA